VRSVKIYLAGPLFTAAERDFNAALAMQLRALGHEVWLPQEAEPRQAAAKVIFEQSVAGIDWAEAVVANMDGADPDSGTCWECGYAYRKKPIIVFRTDFRVGEEIDKGPYNLMLTQSATQCLSLYLATTEQIATAINEALRRIGSPTPADPSGVS
jgi:nucleoside 2-deoxyribosyltransferase